MNQTDFIMRLCSVRRLNEETITELRICVHKPEMTAEGEWWASASISCAFFSKSLRVQGSDGIQAVTSLLVPLLAYLKRQETEHGLAIWWLAPNDLHFSDFWSYLP